MDTLEYIQAVESGLDRNIVYGSSLEKLIYELQEEGETIQYAVELTWDQRDDKEVCESR